MKQWECLLFYMAMKQQQTGCTFLGWLNVQIGTSISVFPNFAKWGGLERQSLWQHHQLPAVRQRSEIIASNFMHSRPLCFDCFPACFQPFLFLPCKGPAKSISIILYHLLVQHLSLFSRFVTGSRLLPFHRLQPSPFSSCLLLVPM